MISIGKILFFILMPLVYNRIYISSLEDKYDKKTLRLNKIINLSFYYIIEIIQIIVHFVITKELLFVKNAQFDFGVFILFVFCSILWISIHLFVCGLGFLSGEENEIEYTHLLVLGILFLLFLLISESNTNKNMKEYYLSQQQYEKVSEEVYNLEAFSDTTAVNGEIHGGMHYINGSIQEDYELYYSFINEKGSLVIRHFTYHENTCEIYPEENCENPILKIETYSRNYKDKSESYNKYILHIPKNSITTNSIDLQ